jgi:hypothetical protein
MIMKEDSFDGIPTATPTALVVDQPLFEEDFLRVNSSNESKGLLAKSF